MNDFPLKPLCSTKYPVVNKLVKCLFCAEWNTLQILIHWNCNMRKSSPLWIMLASYGAVQESEINIRWSLDVSLIAEGTQLHYGDVIIVAIASQIVSLRIVYSTVIQTQIKENIKAPRHWPLCGEFTGDRWIPRTSGQLRGKCFYLMTSLCMQLAL